MHSPTLADDFWFRWTLAFAPFQPILSRCVRCFPSKSLVLTLLRTLFLSLPSFRRSPRLFSIACGLFVQNTGGVGYLCDISALSVIICLFLSPLCFHGLTNCFSRNPFILITICVAPRCGVRAPLPIVFNSTHQLRLCRKFSSCASACYRPHLKGDYVR